LAVESQPVHPHRADDVLDLLLASEIEGPIKLALQMVISRARYDHAARLGELLQASGDIDAVAIDIAVYQCHIAQIDSDAEHDALTLRQPCIARGCRSLDFRSANNRVDHAVEGDDRAVTHELDDAAVVLGDRGIDQLDADGL